LAPLLEGAFNAGRAHTKVFDVARRGAVGVYSERFPYGDAVRNEASGILVPNRPQLWIEQVSALALNSRRLGGLIAQAHELAGLVADRQPAPIHRPST
jgi:hypothetical protein